MTTTMPPPAHTHHHRHCHRYGAAALLLLLLSLLGSAAAQSPGSGSPAGYNGWNGRFNPSMAIIIVVLISAFFFMGFFSIYLRQCGERADPSVRPAGAAAGARSRQAAVRGLDPAVIQTFPTLLYADVKGHKIGKDTLECAVCLSEFEDDDSLRLLPRCDHVFHPDCIDAWLSAHTTCPVCRANLAPDTNAPAPVPAPVSAEEAPAAAAADGGDVGEHQREAAPDDPRPPVHVAITIDVPPAPETPRKTAEASASPAFAQDRVARVESKSRLPWRSKSSVRLQRFPRSHSTGHSMAVVVQPGEDCKRYTLRLPENIRRDIMAGTLQRSSSCAAFPSAGEGSTRKGAFAGEGSSRGGASIGGMSFKLKRWDWVAKSDRWAFLARTFSMRTPRGDAAAEGSTRRGEGSTKRGLDGGEAAGEGSFKGKVFSGVRIPFDCLSGGGDGAPGAAPGSPTKAGGAAKI